MLKNDLIFDLGMHTGQDTDFYLKKGFNVVAIEANPLLVSDTKKRFSNELKSGQLKILNIGIGEKKGAFPFYVNDYLAEWSSFIKEIGTREGNYHEIEVECITLEDVFEMYGVPYYLKIDIEGHDFMALESIRNLEQKPQYVSVENGQKYFLDFFRENGYTGYKFINQKYIQEQILPIPAKEGKKLEYQFEFGATGTFGEETPGQWKEYGDILIDIENYWGNPNRDANIHGWYDLHAKHTCR